MCGIAGIFSFDKRIVSEEIIKKMTSLMSHRGPDDEGFFFGSKIGLGHRRLSIIDLTKSGRQPMSDRRRKMWIVFNGEIYNYIELREELKKLGSVFSSNTDTEVILEAYRCWGEKCLNKFNGMWAFAIWDEEKQELFCSRDRFGIKPFYYFFDKRGFIFASEIKPILSVIGCTQANDKLIYDFLKFGMLDHSDETFFNDIRKLSPGTWMKVKNGRIIATERYWDLVVSDEIDSKGILLKDESDVFLKLFFDAVNIRIRSDVPIGSCLSGGLDSSSIVCVANYFINHEGSIKIEDVQKTFSACFDERNYDEREYINSVIKTTGAENIKVFPNLNDFKKYLDQMIWCQEEPFAGTGIISQWLVFQAAKEKHVTVLLDGQGSDEYLCGYRKFYFFYLRKLLEEKKYFSFINEFFAFFSSLDVLRTINAKVGLRYFGLGKKIMAVDDFLDLSFAKDFIDRKLNFSYKKNFGSRIVEDITKWSLPVLLRYEDKNSMAHSLETRLPFLDYRLVQRVADAPIKFKMKNGFTKIILRQAMRGILPEKIRKRKSKLGFSTPEEEWIKIIIPEMKNVFENSLFIQKYADIKSLVKACDVKSNMKFGINSRIIFRFYILELWGRRFMINHENQFK